MRTKLIMVISAAMLLIPAAYAAQEEIVDLGPYQVSFSLESGRNCTVQVAEPVEGRPLQGSITPNV